MKKLHHPGVKHTHSAQQHTNTRGHQAHLDITEHLDPNTTIKVDFEVSTDNGVTWEYGGGFTSVGGVQHEKNGDVMKHCVVVFGHEPSPEVAPAAFRLVRGSVEVLGAPVNTELTFVGIKEAYIDKTLVPKL